MTDRVNTADNNFVPKTYQELWLHYIVGNGNGDSLVDKLIRNKLKYATEDERESLRCDIFLRMMDFGMIEKFDPAKANFGGAVFFTTRTIVSNHLGRKSRNPITGLCAGSLTSSSPEDGTLVRGEYNMDRMFAPEAPNYEESMTAKTILQEGLYWTERLLEAPKNKRDESLHSVLTMIIAGKDFDEIAKEHGVTRTTVKNWVQHIADHLKDVQEVLS